jgi:phosphoenolpyruvate carboxykinase (GTP)
LQWVVERCRGAAKGVETALGTMPRFEDLNWDGLERKLSESQFQELAGIDRGAWKEELTSHDELFGKLGQRLPPVLDARRERMHQNLG